MLQKAPSRNPAGVDALVRRWQADKDLSARDALVRQYKPFIWQVAHQLARKNRFDVEDAFQWGALGFMRALDTYDPAPAALLGYSKLWMRTFIERNLRRTKSVVTPGHSVAGDSYLVRRAERDLERAGQRATAEILAGKTGLTLSRVNNAISGMAVRCASTATPLPGDESGNSTLGDTLASAHETRPDVLFMEGSTLSGAREAIEEAAARVLKPRYWEVVRMRVYDEMTLEQIGQRLGVTRERVRQIEFKALGKLTEALKGDERVQDLIGEG